ncbi:dihydroorotase [Prochlorococcus marinus]|uniref:Dihydroorotase n=1 Tax=Prochlorococcus marinus XMU1408 TaxID=2213228 RepID=A0A318R9K8_PROMR|nr:dihydroorotase [Prochlorococcus marinus]MBW3041541.1 dihydroorotase [Prochlorococcus marinus str. XMU1408]PYE02699.1 dihydroorotase [Prochlorococcus marinus XMU1408]
MKSSYLFENIQTLEGSRSTLKNQTVLIKDGVIKAFGKKALQNAELLNIKPKNAKNMLLAPCLVDPHSFLESPFKGKAENIYTLIKKATVAGYGQLGILPRSNLWRDQIESIISLKTINSEVLIHIWGAFSLGGKGISLSKHSDLLQNGAIGLADDDFTPPIELLKQGFSLGEMKKSPVLLAPRDISLQAEGMSRESVDTLRAGWPPDPIESEILPLVQLLELHKQYPDIALRLMNISTSEGVSKLKDAYLNPLTTVQWWHLVTDNSYLSPFDIGWSVTPSLGSPKDRASLIKGLEENVLTAISVHSTPTDDSETKQPANRRKKGISGYNLVLPLLWDQLIRKSGWEVEKLWEKLSFGPSKVMNQPEEKLSLDSNRWLLFDPEKEWVQSNEKNNLTTATNQPMKDHKICGKVIDCGLINQVYQND